MMRSVRVNKEKPVRLSGFTLIECLVAMTIIAVAILPMITLVVRERVHDREINLRDLALEVARAEIEWAKNQTILTEGKEVEISGHKFDVEFDVSGADLTVSVRRTGEDMILASLTARRKDIVEK